MSSNWPRPTLRYSMTRQQRPGKTRKRMKTIQTRAQLRKVRQNLNHLPLQTLKMKVKRRINLKHLKQRIKHPPRLRKSPRKNQQNKQINRKEKEERKQLSLRERRISKNLQKRRLMIKKRSLRSRVTLLLANLFWSLTSWQASQTVICLVLLLVTPNLFDLMRQGI